MSRTSFAVHCPVCGDVEMPGDAMCLVVYTTASASYGFWCPRCGHDYWLEADGLATVLLVNAGVRVVRRPVEADEAHAGAPLGYDDLAAFVHDLGRYWCLVALAELAPVRKAVSA